MEDIDEKNEIPPVTKNTNVDDATPPVAKDEDAAPPENDPVDAAELAAVKADLDEALAVMPPEAIAAMAERQRTAEQADRAANKDDFSELMPNAQ
ncbi:carboxypeptidase M32 [Acidithiobacillus caldus]|nr:carboxypeptidase M32 [Acidithiobacillus caldus]